MITLVILTIITTLAMMLVRTIIIATKPGGTRAGVVYGPTSLPTQQAVPPDFGRMTRERASAPVLERGAVFMPPDDVDEARARIIESNQQRGVETHLADLYDKSEE